MRTVIQRVLRAEVRVDGECVGRIGHGVLLLVGVEQGDQEKDVIRTAHKIAAIRCFGGRTPMDLTLSDVNGACLVVSQFTLAAALAKGNRPSFTAAELPERAQALYLQVVAELRSLGLVVATGHFGARMEVELVNDGPVTFVLEVHDGKVLDLTRHD